MEARQGDVQTRHLGALPRDDVMLVHTLERQSDTHLFNARLSKASELKMS